MFLYVFKESEKIKLEKLGFRFMMKKNLNDKEIYIFENNRNLHLNFGENKIIAFITDKLFFT